MADAKGIQIAILLWLAILEMFVIDSTYPGQVEATDIIFLSKLGRVRNGIRVLESDFAKKMRF